MAFKEYDFELTEIAESDIDEAFEYIAEILDNPDAASALVEELEIQINGICKKPESGRIVKNDFLRRNDIWRFLVKNYIAYYIIDDENEKIVILRFIYSGRNQDNIVKDF
jgi:plasmid stabilization system protein ParE